MRLLKIAARLYPKDMWPAMRTHLDIFLLTKGLLKTCKTSSKLRIAPCFLLKRPASVDVMHESTAYFIQITWGSPQQSC